MLAPVPTLEAELVLDFLSAVEGREAVVDCAQEAYSVSKEGQEGKGAKGGGGVNKVARAAPHIGVNEREMSLANIALRAGHFVRRASE